MQAYCLPTVFWNIRLCVGYVNHEHRRSVHLAVSYGSILRRVHMLPCMGKRIGVAATREASFSTRAYQLCITIRKYRGIVCVAVVLGPNLQGIILSLHWDECNWHLILYFDPVAPCATKQ